MRLDMTRTDNGAGLALRAWMQKHYETLCEKNNESNGYIWDVPHPDNVVCIIHGIGEYAGRYNRLAKILNPAGIAVLSMDLPGHGLSAGKRGHAAPRSLVLDDVTEMIRYAEEKWPGIPITLYSDFSPLAARSSATVLPINSPPSLPFIFSIFFPFY